MKVWQYWLGWVVVLIVARLWLVNPILRELRRIHGGG